jgi:hypothetical protein
MTNCYEKVVARVGQFLKLWGETVNPDLPPTRTCPSRQATAVAASAVSSPRGSLISALFAANRPWYVPTIICFRQPTFTETVESKEGSVIHAVVFHIEANGRSVG